ncbi:hypothetical protein C8D87_103339 [Lentzea atacamensis]|uniref:Uncharacterized protein n=1 Tax=Lentzea atacamensis TaxID=531938 RepID=A0ABX9EA25_9PSEU|nr:hypothetical protein C8D87_103339 [Lentzea atacamensis]
MYFESHDGFIWSFQMPCRFAGCVPGRDDEIRRYLPYWNSRTENCGSLVLACRVIRTSVGWSAAGVRPRSRLTRPNSAW